MRSRVLSTDATGDAVAFMKRALDIPSLGLLKPQTADDYHALGNLLVIILFAMIVSAVVVAFHDSRERPGGEWIAAVEG